jgi:hypothetical protein
MDEDQMLALVEHYSRKAGNNDEKIKITRIPDWKTVYIEKTDGIGRSIVMSEYRVDGKTYWAGYSLDSQTVFISQAAKSHEG